MSKLLGMMDWQAALARDSSITRPGLGRRHGVAQPQAGEGEPNEGLLGAGAADALVRFGAIGEEEVAPDDDVRARPQPVVARARP